MEKLLKCSRISVSMSILLINIITIYTHESYKIIWLLFDVLSVIFSWECYINNEKVGTLLC